MLTLPVLKFLVIMSNEKNAQPAPNKKESVSVLEKIRRRTGLLVGIVGLALVIFILESLLGSGASIFGNDEMSAAGYINGKKVDRNEFIMRLENQLNNYRQRNGGKEIDDATRSQALESVWQQYIIDQVMNPEFKRVGLMVGEDEIYQNVVVNPAQAILQNLTNQQTNRIDDQFARPDGTLDPNKWKQAVQNVTGDNEMAVRSMEEQVKSTRYFEKFRSLITKGLYVTNAEAKQKFEIEQHHLSVSFVGKRLDAVSDSAVKVTDEELEKYFNEHTYLYYNLEANRRIEYVTFNVLPTPEDVASVEKEAIRVAGDMKGKTTAEDSAIMMQENENGAITISDFTRKNMPVRDSSVYKSAPGTVFGPYNEGAYFKVYKLEAINSLADSARVRHILVGINDPKTSQPKRSMATAKREADSVLVLLKAKKVSFDTLVKTYSDDLGSITKGGDYGWFDEEEGFVEPFKNAGLKGTKGNITVVETQFGYHIIEVLDVSKSRHNSFKIAQVMKMIAPTEETTQSIFAKANQFAGENNTGELFDKGVEKEKLTKRLADNIREGEYQVPGLDSPKELVKWAYTAKKGDVSLFNFNDRFIVAKLSSIKEKGTMPFEDVKEEVAMRVRKEKKGEMLLKEFAAAANAKTIDEVAAALKLTVVRQENMDFGPSMVDQFGHDEVFVGKAFGSKTGTVSKAFAGELGVYMFVLTAERRDAAPVDFVAQRQDIERQITGRSDYEVFNVLKEKANIEFHKSRLD
jgi:peptidyl-prolyl cis-trans isomerase D